MDQPTPPAAHYAVATRQGRASNWVLLHTGLRLDDAIAKRDALTATKAANRDRLAARIDTLTADNQPDWMKNSLSEALDQLRYLDETDYEVVQPA